MKWRYTHVLVYCIIMIASHVNNQDCYSIQIMHNREVASKKHSPRGNPTKARTHEAESRACLGPLQSYRGWITLPTTDRLMRINCL